MKYVSIDIETLGLDPDTCDVIEVGAVIDDLVTPIDKLEKFKAYICRESYRGQAYAMSMHSKLLKKISSYSIVNVFDESENAHVTTSDMIASLFKVFLHQHYWKNTTAGESIVVAGKNFASFDWRFLRRLPNFSKDIKIKHIVIDPSMFFMTKDMIEPPSTEKCLELMGIKKEVAHTSIEDALDVIRMVRFGLKVDIL
jgi:DNA polymerase III epsilon subunit-like protein